MKKRLFKKNPRPTRFKLYFFGNGAEVFLILFWRLSKSFLNGPSKWPSLLQIFQLHYSNWEQGTNIQCGCFSSVAQQSIFGSVSQSIIIGDLEENIQLLMTKITDDRKTSRLVNNKSVLQSDLDPMSNRLMYKTENMRSRNQENRSCLLAEVAVFLKR